LLTVFLLSGLFRFLAILVLRGLREPGSSRTAHALNAMLSWRGGRDGVLNLPVRVDSLKEHREQEIEFWPLFGRRRKKSLSKNILFF